jgi:hypothetical protein
MRFSVLRFVACSLSIGLLGFSGSARAGATVDDLRKEVEDLRKRVNQRDTVKPSIGKVDSALASKYGPNAEVTTKAGRLEIGGLLQLWSISDRARDQHDVFTTGTGETLDNGNYAIRRAEMRFTIDIHENITAKIVVDPARENIGTQRVPSNQGLFKSRPFVSPEFDAANGPGLGSTAEVAAVQNGNGGANRMLLDAYINYHGVLPHHDVNIGQFKPRMGEEGFRDNGNLDFVERAMVTQIAAERDLGLQVHGTWWSDRFQYWTGIFDGAGNYFGTGGANLFGSGQFGNRSDDNDEKDFLASFLVRPIWNQGCWGNLELGYSGEWGTHGESAGADPTNTPVNGLNRDQTAAIRHAAWFMYKPMGPVRGWWVRAEWGYQKDRAVPSSVGAFGLGGGPNGEQAAPNPFHRQGWFASTGYRFSESIWAERLEAKNFFCRLIQPMEFVARYEVFQNIVTEDLVQPDTHTDLFSTKVLTLGVNAYQSGYRHRVQYNYMFVNEAENKTNNGARTLREVKNNVWMVSYQMYF